MFNFGPIFLVLVGPPFYLHGTFQPSMFPWNGSLHDHWDPTKVPYLFQDKGPKLHGLLGWISTCARTQATYCCNQEALPHQPADVAEALLRMQFQQSGWFFGIFGRLARRDTYQKITLYYVETSVKGQFKCLAMAFYEKTLLQYILFEPSWWPHLSVLSWLHSSLRRSSHLNMHKRARIHERGGLEGMTLGSTNVVGKAIQDGQRG